MRRTRTSFAAIAAVSVAVSLVGCRGSEDDSADDGDSGEAVEAAEDTGAAADGTAGGGSEGTAAGGGECPEEVPGVTEDSILLGGSYPLSGPAAAYSAIPDGAQAWFDHLNETQGGFQLQDGRTLEINWEILDDGYEPPRALQNVRQLIEQDGVFLVLDPLGTPPNSAIRDYMNSQEVPQLFVATGASKWGAEIEDFPWTIGLQPDYEAEGVAYAKHILEESPDAQIGILYQNDDFGADYLNGIHEGLGDQQDQIVQEVSYEVTDASIDNQVTQLKNAGADTFISITTPTFAVQSIQRVAALDWDPLFVLTSVSASVGSVMRPAGPENGVGIVTSNYLRDPTDPEQAEDPALVEYREILGQYAPDADPDDAFNVFGMNMAQIFQALIEGMEEPLCRQTIMDAAKNFSHEPKLTLEGIDVETGPGDGFPISQVQLQRFDGEVWVPFGDIIEGRPAGGESESSEGSGDTESTEAETEETEEATES